MIARGPIVIASLASIAGTLGVGGVYLAHGWPATLLALVGVVFFGLAIGLAVGCPHIEVVDVACSAPKGTATD